MLTVVVTGLLIGLVVAGLIETERITGWNYHRRSEAGLRHARQLIGEV